MNDQELFELENEVDELEHERLRQDKGIAGLERGLNSASEHAVGKKAITNNTIHTMSNELHTTKTKLQGVAKRESKVIQ